jgi:4-diphosphocytidyl-2-C-methyl-D-erythritol kinase
MFAARPMAKVNLTLEVGPLGDDGYHPLRSLFLRIGLSDRLDVRPAAASAVADRLTMVGLAGAPVEGNIVLRAMAAVRERAGLPLPPLDVELDKRIPVAAGLGGGSSDAASALRLAQACWGVGLAAAEELELAAALGSDVPFFVADAEVALVEGRGEVVRSLPGADGGAGVLLVTPRVELSTRAVFARHDQLAGQRAERTTSVSDDLAMALDNGLSGFGLRDWAGRLRDANDLWSAAASLEPRLPALRDALERRTDRPWLLSGSGPTLFALYPSVTDAADAGRALADDGPPSLGDALIHAVDLIGPEPEWRYP